MKVNEQRLVGLLVELTATDSGSRQERLMADKVRQKLEQLGFTVEEDDAGAKVGGNAGNLKGRLKGTAPGPAILFSAHLDRVANGFGVKPQVRDGAVYSDGSTILGADDAAGIAAVLEAVQVLKENNLPYPTIEVAFTVCEEVGLLGAKELDAAWFTAAVGYALDGSGAVGTAYTRAPSQARLEATVFGRSAHAGVAPEQGINAIQVAGRALAAMPLGRIDAETTANIGIIQGGQATNIVPDTCKLTGEARSLDEEKLKAQLEAMQRAIEQACQEAGARAEVTIRPSYTSSRLTPEMPVVIRFEKACARLGLTPSLQATGGGSDANILNGKGLPTLVLGIGYEQIHSTQEYMPIAQLVQAAEMALALVQQEG